MKFTRTHIILIPWLWLALMVIAPLLVVLAIAMAEPAEGVPPFAFGLTWANFALVFTDPFYRSALFTSLKVATLSTIACLLLGYPMAFAIARAPSSLRGVLLGGVMLPFWSGFLMRINAWIGLLSDGGWLNATLTWFGLPPYNLLYTDAAMYVGIVYTYLPFMILPLYTALSRIDPTLMEAAGDLGATPIAVFLRITLPLSVSGIAAGCALVLIPALGEFVIPELLGGPDAVVIGRVLWGEFFNNRDWPTAAAIAISLLALTILLPAIALLSIHPSRRRRRP